MSSPTQNKLHPRNPHSGRYDFERLCKSIPELQDFLRPNPAGDSTIDFADAAAVRCLNGAILAADYGVHYWALPAGYLCPPIPGRADYIHYLADLLAADSDGGEVPRGKRVRVLDIGTGANCIYPILGCRSYGWKFVGSDIDPVSLASADAVVQSNAVLNGHIELRLQRDQQKIFANIVEDDAFFDLSMCNPPFHASAQEAASSNRRKRQNLAGRPAKKISLDRNFSGTQQELWCRGGEIAFLKRMVRESVDFADQVAWFSSLVSKSQNVGPLKKLLVSCGVKEQRVVEMRQGQKISRFVAWRF